MSKENNLSDLLRSVADAIREKKKTTDLINPQNFDTEIESIQGGDYSEITATPSDVRAGTKFINSDGELVDGAVTDRTAQTEVIVEPGANAQFVPGGQYKDNQTYIHLAPDAAGIIKDGENILGVQGTFKGIDTDDATAQANDILLGKTAYSGGEKITGTIPTYSGAIETDVSASQDKTVTITQDGQVIIEADPGKVLNKVIINVNVQEE